MARCPSCFTPLTRVVEDDIKSATCANCFGTWINAGSLMRRTQLDVRQANERFSKNSGQAGQNNPDANQPSFTDLAAVTAESNSTQYLRCAQCERLMFKERFHPMIPVEVDRCKACGYIWLDAGEFLLVRKLYAELMTTNDPEVTRRRDKVASVAAEWQAHRISVEDSRQALRDQHNTSTNDAFDLLEYLTRSVR